MERLRTETRRLETGTRRLETGTKKELKKWGMIGVSVKKRRRLKLLLMVDTGVALKKDVQSGQYTFYAIMQPSCSHH